MPITDFFTTQIDAIKSAGANYQLAGDPVVALVAQLNRFAGRSVRVGTCQTSRFVREKLPLVPHALDPVRMGTFPGTDLSITGAIVDAAVNIVNRRYTCVDPALYDKHKAMWTLGREVCEVVVDEATTANLRATLGPATPPITKIQCRTAYDTTDRVRELAWLKTNLKQVIETIAQVGDAAGLPPAEAGITKPDPDLTPPKKKYGPFIIAGVGLLAVAGAFAFTRRRSRTLPAAM